MLRYCELHQDHFKGFSSLAKKAVLVQRPPPSCSLNQLQLRENYTYNAMLLLLLTLQFNALLCFTLTLTAGPISEQFCQASYKPITACSNMGGTRSKLTSVAVLTNSTVGKSKPIKGTTRRPLSNLTSLHPGATVFTQHLQRIYSSLQPYLHVQYLQIETLCQI